MSTLGQKLKERREDLGYTLEEMQEKTKITSAKLKAIEEGNLSYFNSEQSYLKFYVQYYSQALHIPFSEIEEDFNHIYNDYSQTLLLKRDEFKQTSNENIQKRIEKNKELYQSSFESEKRKFDKSSFSSIGMIILSIVIVLILAYGVVQFIIPMLTDSNQTVNIPEIPEVPQEPNVPQRPEDETPVDNPDEPIDEPVVIKVTQIDPQIYEVNLDGTTDSKLTITFGSSTWIEVSINNIPTKNPASRIYQPDESVEILLNPQEQQEITVHVGTMLDNEFFLNDQSVVFDESITNFNSGIRITFRLV